MAAAVTPQAEALARLAVEETGFGVVADKVQKNLFAAAARLRVHQADEDGRRDRAASRTTKVIEIAEPFGVVAAIVPSTNPTSTAIYKILIAIKARCADRHQPASVGGALHHPRRRDHGRGGARRPALPDGAIGWMTTVTLEGTQELMKQREVAGDSRHRRHGPGARRLQRRQAGLRRRARATRRATSSRSADVAQGRARHHHRQVASTTACSARRRTRWSSTRRSPRKRDAQFQAQGGYFLSPAEADALAKRAGHAAAAAEPGARRQVGDAHRREGRHHGAARHARADRASSTGVGRDYPLSIEKLCPVLSYYVVKDWREGCERCKQILRYGGMGHTMSIHSQNDDGDPRVRPAQAGLSASVVNTPTTHGSIGLTTGPRSGDDARLRRLRRQHHLGQHLAAAPAEHQAARLRAAAGAGRPSAGASGAAALRAPAQLRRRGSPRSSAPRGVPVRAAPDRPVPGVARSATERRQRRRRPPAPVRSRRQPAPPAAGGVRLRRRRPRRLPRRAGASCSAERPSSPPPPATPEKPCGCSTCRPELSGAG